MDETQELFLHICCAPCGAGCVKHPDLDPERKVTLFYSNSNLDTFEEFEKRLHEVKRLAEFYGLELIVDPYDHEAWLQAVKGLENEPEGGNRCRKCFNFNLNRARSIAQERKFATTLTVSPRKSSAVIFEVGGRWTTFEKIDFKKKNGYLTGRNFAREHDFYRQNYCGCEFSRRDDQAVKQKEFQL
jgi:predicted adenine nucleotide alpha hydrolase (AANH) superfamily ATPase